MDLQSQEAILRLAEEHGASELVVVLGAPDPESAEIAAETVVVGDPSYAGPLAGAQLGLDVRHILDEELREEVPDDVWEDQIGVMADILEADALASSVRSVREKAAGT
jgi:betaine reductase